jgi:hypothetical protein
MENPNVSKEKKLLFLDTERNRSKLQHMKKKSGKHLLLERTRRLQETRKRFNQRNGMKRKEVKRKEEILSLLSSIAHLSYFLSKFLNKPNKTIKFNY